ncbi:hypothetical protein S40288_11338 [Stachybotrys chartarum IBT 40288]|nr:hypothetical protein S40288_11338 [Stachybotrys chartarum IBT 40288]
MLSLPPSNQTPRLPPADVARPPNPPSLPPNPSLADTAHVPTPYLPLRLVRHRLSFLVSLSLRLHERAAHEQSSSTTRPHLSTTPAPSGSRSVGSGRQGGTVGVPKEEQRSQDQDEESDLEMPTAADHAPGPNGDSSRWPGGAPDLNCDPLPATRGELQPRGLKNSSVIVWASAGGGGDDDEEEARATPSTGAPPSHPTPIKKGPEDQDRMFTESNGTSLSVDWANAKGCAVETVPWRLAADPSTTSPEERRRPRRIEMDDRGRTVELIRVPAQGGFRTATTARTALGVPGRRMHFSTDAGGAPQETVPRCVDA